MITANRVPTWVASLIVGVTLWYAAPAWAAMEAKLVYPPDKALLTGDGTLTLLGYRPGGAPGTIAVIGTSGSRPVEVPAGPFSAEVKLDPGENVLVFGKRKATVFLAGGEGSAAPPAFAQPDLHAVDNGCEECHSFSRDAARLLEPVPALCQRCHDDPLKGKDGKPHAVAHPPADEKDCLACHKFHGLSLKNLPAAAKREICFGCHDDFTEGGKKRMHAPVAKGDCTGCHEVHGSSGERLLPATGVKLCVLCHADPSHAKDGKDWAVTHPALDEGCASCHLPHVSASPGLLKKPQSEVCADCHDAFPAEEAGRQLVMHSPVEEGSCAECHAVHGSDTEKLLAREGAALCAGCHDDPSKGADGKEWPTPHPALDDGCLTCHLPHVAPAAGMLKKQQAPLCFECHDAIQPFEGQGASIHPPVAQGRCSGCHSPHGSVEKKLLAASPSKDLCLKCHKDPALSPSGEEWAVPHPALDDGCPTCHRPHVAPAPRLLSSPQRELCAGCHEDKDLNGEGVEWSAPHAPVKRGLCSSCHGPHGASEKSLLLKSPFELCRSCHVDVHERHQRTQIDPDGELMTGSTRLPVGFPVRKSDGTLGCVGCHLPHGSDNRLMWILPAELFCTGCHRY